MSLKITTVTPPVELAEGPHWDESTQALYFVDIWKSTIHRYIPESDQYTCTKIHIPGQEEKPVSLIIPVKNEKNKFVISYGADLALITWDGENDPSDYQILATAEQDGKNSTRFNDGKCSPSGVLFAGSMAVDQEKIPNNLGNFYSFKNLNSKLLLKNIGISNGLAWSDDEKLFYYIDSLTYKVEGFDHDSNKAEISNRRTVFDLKQNNIEAFPDGMTIDADGNLWVACYEGSRVLKINPKTGTLLDTISLPTPNITSVAFGGKNLDELYVTSARYETFARNIKEDDTAAGCVFKIIGTGSKGIAGASIDISNISTH